MSNKENSKTMKTQIKIDQINYFGQRTNSEDFNAKCLYTKNGKLQLAHIYVDFFNESIHISQNQPKECKVYKGLQGILNSYDLENIGKC